MIRIRPAAARGRTLIDWLDSRHTFSFGEYYDPAHMGFRSLRVLNDDRVHPGSGFPTHGHRDMEIVTYVLEGALEHKDSLGNGSVIRPGEVQRMSAGTGIRHSEWNQSKAEPVHFLQIWVLPECPGLQASYEQKAIDVQKARSGLLTIASRAGGEGVTLHQDAAIVVALLDKGQRTVHMLAPGRHAWVHVARGAVRLNGAPLAEGDGAAVSDESRIELEGVEPAEALVFDLG
jgi:redox-sensitive bicupin YhaK (pirin superfamily)